MSFLTPLGLLAFLAVPVVLVLHLFRRKYKERIVAGLFLWAPDLLRSQSGRKKTRLLRSPSLWLELLAASIAALILAGLQVGASSTSEPLVLVLDDSASMSAIHDGRSVRDRTVSEILTLLDAQPKSTRCTVILSGTHPRVLSGPGASPPEVRDVLAGWQPLQAAHRLEPALSMGRQMTAGAARLYLFTDSDPGPVEQDYDVTALGRSLGNTALLGARRIRSTDGTKLLVDLLSFDDKPSKKGIEIRLLGTGDAPPVFEATTRLVPDQVQHFSIDLPAHSGTIQIDLGEDALAVDNQILLLPESLKIVRLEQDLEAPLARSLGIAQLVDAIPGLEFAGPGDLPTMRIATEPGPTQPWRTEFLVRVPEESTALLGPFLLERRHPLLQGVQLDGVIWSASESKAPEGFPLVLAGRIPLLTEEKQPRFVRYRIGIDPTRSNLAKAPDWPILLSNLADLTRAWLPGQVGRNHASNEELIYRHAGPMSEIVDMRLVTPAGQERRATGLRELRFAPEGPGIYRLVREGRELARWSLHFVDPSESDLRTRSNLHRAAAPNTEPGAEQETRPGEWERNLLSLLLLLLVLADWWALGRGGSA